MACMVIPVRSHVSYHFDHSSLLRHESSQRLRLHRPVAAVCCLWLVCIMLAGFCLQDPFADKTTYNDSPVDKVFIKLFTQKMADQLGPGAGPAPTHTSRCGRQVKHRLSCESCCWPEKNSDDSRMLLYAQVASNCWQISQHLLLVGNLLIGCCYARCACARGCNI
jgi:hypothetical protein